MSDADVSDALVAAMGEALAIARGEMQPGAVHRPPAQTQDLRGGGDGTGESKVITPSLLPTDNAGLGKH